MMIEQEKWKKKISMFLFTKDVPIGFFKFINSRLIHDIGRI
jgi:hypothetical protein